MRGGAIFFSQEVTFRLLTYVLYVPEVESGEALKEKCWGRWWVGVRAAGLCGPEAPCRDAPGKARAWGPWKIAWWLHWRDASRLSPEMSQKCFPDFKTPKGSGVAGSGQSQLGAQGLGQHRRV